MGYQTQILALLLLSSSALSSPCTSSKLLPHEDCDKFVQCSNGIPYVMPCAPGTLFDYQLQICNHAWAVTCTPVENQEVTTTTETPNGYLPNGCPLSPHEHILLPHEQCDKFYQCVHGVKIEMNCGAGTLFDVDLQVCNWPNQVTCLQTTTTNQPTTTSQPTTTIQQNLSTSSTTSRPYPQFPNESQESMEDNNYTESENHSEKTTTGTNYSELTTESYDPTTEAALCPVGFFGNVANPNDKCSYFMCSGGISIPLFCASGYEFDVESTTCNAATEGPCALSNESEEETNDDHESIVDSEEVEEDENSIENSFEQMNEDTTIKPDIAETTIDSETQEWENYDTTTKVTSSDSNANTDTDHGMTTDGNFEITTDGNFEHVSSEITTVQSTDGQSTKGEDTTTDANTEQDNFTETEIIEETNSDSPNIETTTTTTEQNGSDLTTEQQHGSDWTTEQQTSSDLTTEQQNGSDLTTEQQNGSDLTTDQQNGSDLTTVQSNGSDLTTEQSNGSDLTTEQQNSSDLTTEQQNGSDGYTEQQNGFDGTTEQQNGFDWTTESQNGSDLTTEAPLCPDNFFGYVANPNDCGSYYMCSGSIAIPLFCASGYTYNSVIEGCVIATEGPCALSEITEESTTDSLEDLNTVTTSYENIESLETITEEYSTFKPTGTDQEHEENSQETTTGPITTELNSTDHTTESSLTTEPSNSDTTTTENSEKTTTEYSETTTLEYSEMTTIETDSQSTATEGPICPANVFGNVAHPTSCDTYYMCSNGFAIQLYCPVGSEFDPETEQCTEIRPGGCTIGKIETTTSSNEDKTSSIEDNTSSNEDEIPEDIFETVPKPNEPNTETDNEDFESTEASDTYKSSEVEENNSNNFEDNFEDFNDIASQEDHTINPEENIEDLNDIESQEGPINDIDDGMLVEEEVLCPSGFFGSVANPEVCNSYFMCTGGFAIPLHCADGLEFDLDSQACIPIAEGGCTHQQIRDKIIETNIAGELPTNGIENVENEGLIEIQLDGVNETEHNEYSMPEEESRYEMCATGKYVTVPHEFLNNSYYLCVGGTTVQLYCDNGYLYDVLKDGCIYSG